MKEKIKEVLEDHLDYLRESESQDQTMEKINYLSSLIAHRVMEKVRESNLRIEEVESHEDIHSEKIGARRVKSYGFFKNEYYDD